MTTRDEHPFFLDDLMEEFVIYEFGTAMRHKSPPPPPPPPVIFYPSTVHPPSRLQKATNDIVALLDTYVRAVARSMRTRAIREGEEVHAFIQHWNGLFPPVTPELPE